MLAEALGLTKKKPSNLEANTTICTFLPALVSYSTLCPRKNMAVDMAGRQLSKKLQPGHLSGPHEDVHQHFA